MREVALFLEDSAHRRIVGALVQRLADNRGIQVRMICRNAEGGHGRVLDAYRDYLRDVVGRSSFLPDLILVAIDANCSGLNDRTQEFVRAASFGDVPLPPTVFAIPAVLAIPDPHIERWLLLDGAAFNGVLGRGCDAPDHEVQPQPIQAASDRCCIGGGYRTCSGRNRVGRGYSAADGHRAGQAGRRLAAPISKQFGCPIPTMELVVPTDHVYSDTGGAPPMSMAPPYSKFSGSPEICWPWTCRSRK